MEARIYLKGSKNLFYPVKSTELAEKMVTSAMKEFSLPRSHFYIMSGEELEDQRLAEEAYRLNKKLRLGVDMEKPIFKF